MNIAAGVPIPVDFGCVDGVVEQEDGTLLIDGSILEGGGQVMYLPLLVAGSAFPPEHQVQVFLLSRFYETRSRWRHCLAVT